MSLVQVTVRDGVACVTLDDPDRRNALGGPLGAELVAAIDAIEADPEIGAVVLTGAGSAFCAGADLSDLGESEREGLLEIYESFLRVARCPLPTIAAVNGAAVGAGMNLALACDVRLAARRARFDTRFLQLGIHPGGGHTWMLRRAVGPQAAAAALLFSEVLDGAEAERVGLAWRCVEDDALLDLASQMAARAAAAPPELVRETKATLATMAGVATHAEAVEVELGPQVRSIRAPAFAERLAALKARISSAS